MMGGVQFKWLLAASAVVFAVLFFASGSAFAAWATLLYSPVYLASLAQSPVIFFHFWRDWDWLALQQAGEVFWRASSFLWLLGILLIFWQRFVLGLIPATVMAGFLWLGAWIFGKFVEISPAVLWTWKQFLLLGAIAVLFVLTGYFLIRKVITFACSLEISKWEDVVLRRTKGFALFALRPWWLLALFLPWLFFHRQALAVGIPQTWNLWVVAVAILFPIFCGRGISRYQEKPSRLWPLNPPEVLRIYLVAWWPFFRSETNGWRSTLICLLLIAAFPYYSNLAHVWPTIFSSEGLIAGNVDAFGIICMLAILSLAAATFFRPSGALRSVWFLLWFVVFLRFWSLWASLAFWPRTPQNANLLLSSIVYIFVTLFLAVILREISLWHKEVEARISRIPNALPLPVRLAAALLLPGALILFCLVLPALGGVRIVQSGAISGGAGAILALALLFVASFFYASTRVRTSDGGENEAMWFGASSLEVLLAREKERAEERRARKLARERELARIEKEAEERRKKEADARKLREQEGKLLSKGRLRTKCSEAVQTSCSHCGAVIHFEADTAMDCCGICGEEFPATTQICCKTCGVQLEGNPPPERDCHSLQLFRKDSKTHNQGFPFEK